MGWAISLGAHTEPEPRQRGKPGWALKPFPTLPRCLLGNMAGAEGSAANTTAVSLLKSSLGLPRTSTGCSPALRHSIQHSHSSHLPLQPSHTLPSSLPSQHHCSCAERPSGWPVPLWTGATLRKDTALPSLPGHLGPSTQPSANGFSTHLRPHRGGAGKAGNQSGVLSICTPIRVKSHFPLCCRKGIFSVTQFPYLQSGHNSRIAR